MKIIIRFLSVMLLLTALSSCALFEDPKQEAVDITTLNIADDFNFETERWINVELHALYTGTFHLTDMEGNMLYKGTIDQQVGFVQKIKLPTRIVDVKILYKEVDTVTENYHIRDNEIVYSFVPQYL
ncbi:MAG: hypothetical protein K9N06_05970 [Candidatus Cloacimonetes bacterium]|nr:hypothetical protein [Candidatus Cloacimonadota bacterium]